MRLVRAEIQKLMTTRLWWVMLLVLFLYMALQIGVTIGFAGQVGAQGQPVIPARGTVPFQEVVWSMGAGGALFPMILGIVMMTAEYRYQTITGTFLATPRRERVVAAKLGAGVLVGLAFGLAVLVLEGAAVVVATLAAGEDVAVNAKIARIAVGVLAVLALYTLFGIGLGALVRNQLGAIVGGVIWVLLVESLVNAIPALQPVGKWTPAGAAAAVTNSEVDLGVGTEFLLPAWAGAGVLLGYGVLFALVASVTTVRRDIT
ncbi:ABC transporter permease [Nonomuraea sp. NBC_01738]|uniref:ABC transporter permease n=1 Tax=Nonomuraea sp. NBC_01738 TaxID=2976003 RepID=UPI002E0D3250|nr:ABC transporter permease [Nonomuraea sp. NBC_01738]